MATEVSICSNALLMLGDNPISDFQEGTRAATVCANLYPDVRDDILRAKFWTCACKRDLLAPDPDPPAFGYLFRFLKPADWLRTKQVGEDYHDERFSDEDGFILADVNPLPLRYAYRLINPSKYDSMLVRVLTLAMAAQLAYPITKSAAVEQNRFQLLSDQIKRSASIASQDDGPEDMGSFDLLRARFGNRTRTFGGW
jgi:hypothetical protein